jgi:hypothetical protein
LRDGSVVRSKHEPDLRRAHTSGDARCLLDPFNAAIIPQKATGAAVKTGRLSQAGKPMFKNLLVSIVLVPVLLGMYAGKSRRQQAGLTKLVALFFVYVLLYLIMLYYLRYRWVG